MAKRTRKAVVQAVVTGINVTEQVQRLTAAMADIEQATKELHGMLKQVDFNGSIKVLDRTAKVIGRQVALLPRKAEFAAKRAERQAARADREAAAAKRRADRVAKLRAQLAELEDQE